MMTLTIEKGDVFPYFYIYQISLKCRSQTNIYLLQVKERKVLDLKQYFKELIKNVKREKK